MSATGSGRIDAHQHFWRPSRGDYRWLTPAIEPLFRDFEPAHLAPHLARHQVERTVLVQAADTIDETRFLLDVADRCGFVGAVVGWVDLEREDVPSSLAALAAHPLFRGVRPMIQDIADPDWMLRESVQRGLDEVERLGLSFDALVRPVNLPRLLRVAERHPSLPIVIDHAAKPRVADGAAWTGRSAWRSDLAALSAQPNVSCKLSGLASEARLDWTVADLQPFVATVMECFGPQRTLWGSDWPVVELAGGYDRWADATTVLLADLDDDDRCAVLGGNAARIYGIDATRTAGAASSSGTHTT
ncbi:MAG: amidohydrolase family protein [Phycisphaerales bacterium]|nr:amidohydrolase family protein [Phycisphaerales bacterium]